MATGALFGGSASRSQSKHLVEFRAGKMYMKGKMVHADKRKGLIYVHQTEADSLMHFCWKERSKSNAEEDLMIFPDDAEFKHVPQCTTGRVYLLRFKSTGRKLFFWMQEPKVDKDEDLARKVNDFLNNPPAPGSIRSSGGGGGGGGGGLGIPAELAAGLGGDSELQSMLGNMSQQQLMQLLGGMGMGGMGGLSALMGGGRPGSAQSDSQPPSRVQSSPGPRSSGTDTPAAPRPVTAAALPSQPSDSTPATPAQPIPTSLSPPPAPVANRSSSSSSSSGQKPAIQLSDLQNILSGISGEGAGSGGREAIDLATAVTPESMIPILANAGVQERLLTFLPEGEVLPRTEAELRSTVQSPQFQQAMQSFSAALASGQLGPLMQQFNLGDDVANAAAAGDVEAFATAMQSASGGRDEKKDEKKEDKKEEKEEKMEEDQPEEKK